MSDALFSLMIAFKDRRYIMRIYEGYRTGHPVYTIKGNQIYQGYGTGHPIYTLKGNQVYQGYGTGHPVYKKFNPKVSKIYWRFD